jgi:hypothetical protein
MPEFQFASSASTHHEKLWDWYCQLARARRFVDVLYDHSHPDRVNAYHGFGNRWVPAVQLKEGGSLNWWLSTSGKIRPDGNYVTTSKVEIDMRRAFKTYTPGEITQHMGHTNRSSKRPRSVQSNSAEDAAKAARARRIFGHVLACGAAQIFHRDAQSGIWDILDSEIGTRNVPPYYTSPWTVFLRNGVPVSVQPNGEIIVSTSTARTSDVEAIESLLEARVGAQWILTAVHADNVRSKPTPITFGIPGHVAASRHSIPAEQVFH